MQIAAPFQLDILEQRNTLVLKQLSEDRLLARFFAKHAAGGDFYDAASGQINLTLKWASFSTSFSWAVQMIHAGPGIFRPSTA